MKKLKKGFFTALYLVLKVLLFILDQIDGALEKLIDWIQKLRSDKKKK